MKSLDEMARLNKKQGQFYDAIHDADAIDAVEGYSKNQSANFVTRVWASLRSRQHAAVQEAGIQERKLGLHRAWLAEKAGGVFLEVGCFSGSEFTFDLADRAGHYVGVELSEKAAVALREKFRGAGLTHKAEVISGDFLLLPEERRFDLIYAHGVLHHFQGFDTLFQKLARLLQPAGLLIFTEPSAIHPVYRILRAAYRPFQSDSAWEWPFTRATVESLERYFEPVDGFGWGRYSLPLSVLTAMPLAGPMIRGRYLRSIHAEVGAGWHEKVWHNSMVTAKYRPRPPHRSSARS
jgi:SAM-dependent methyltransferase